jgi:hypothetical protein
VNWKQSGNHGSFNAFSLNNHNILYFQCFLVANLNIQEIIDTPIPKSGLRDTGDPSLPPTGKSRGNKRAKKNSTKNDPVAPAIRTLEASSEQRMLDSGQRFNEQMALQEKKVALKGHQLAWKREGFTMKFKANTKKELKAVNDRIGELVNKTRVAKRDLKDLDEENAKSQDTQNSDIDDLEDQLKRLKSEHSSAVRLLKKSTAKIEGREKEEEEAKEEAKNKDNSTRAQPDTTNVQSPRSNERAAAGVDDADWETDDDENDLLRPFFRTETDAEVYRTGKAIEAFLDAYKGNDSDTADDDVDAGS